MAKQKQRIHANKVNAPTLSSGRLTTAHKLIAAARTLNDFYAKLQTGLASAFGQNADIGSAPGMDELKNIILDTLGIPIEIDPTGPADDPESWNEPGAFVRDAYSDVLQDILNYEDTSDYEEGHPNPPPSDTGGKINWLIDEGRRLRNGGMEDPLS